MKEALSSRFLQLENWFFHSSAGILVVTGAAKVWSSFGDAKLLAYNDPIVGVKFRYLMLTAGLLELGLAFFYWFTRKEKTTTTLMAWLSTIFLGYRFGIWWVDWKHPCQCLGELVDALHISPEAADNIAKVLLGYLLIGSYWLLLKWRRADAARGRQTAPLCTTDPAG